jgi:triosephosphate isomerase (TIM)
MKKQLIGNWKMNQSLEELRDFATFFAREKTAEKLIAAHARVAICPQALHLSTLSELTRTQNIQVLAQNISAFSKGAYTGEISAAAVKDLGIKGTLIGHSERRSLFAETHQTLLQKLEMAFTQDLDVIFCVGETLEEREKGQFEKVLASQLEGAKEFLQKSPQYLPRFTLAYEPVWAIGTGKVADTQQIEQAHNFLLTILPHSPILYGGSVTPDNWGEICKISSVSGALVGGASLKASTFFQLLSLSA